MVLENLEEIDLSNLNIKSNDQSWKDLMESLKTNVNVKKIKLPYMSMGLFISFSKMMEENESIKEIVFDPTQFREQVSFFTGYTTLGFEQLSILSEIFLQQYAGVVGENKEKVVYCHVIIQRIKNFMHQYPFNRYLELNKFPVKLICLKNIVDSDYFEQLNKKYTNYITKSKDLLLIQYRKCHQFLTPYEKNISGIINEFLDEKSHESIYLETQKELKKEKQESAHTVITISEALAEDNLEEAIEPQYEGAWCRIL
jgi:hypothetical protein